ncbi:MAG TPA: hypothetical protein ENK73_01745 [Thiomicrospira sp.]|nr:hypothetical protein [Thiomicrospira sp.]
MKYRNQANLIAQGFQVPSYKILETRINMPNTISPRPMYARSKMAMMASDIAAPTVKAGQSKLNITISGTILLPN